MGCDPSAAAGELAGIGIGTAAAVPMPRFRVSTPRSETGRPPSATRGGYAHGIAGGGWLSVRNGYGTAQQVRCKKEAS